MAPHANSTPGNAPASNQRGGRIDTMQRPISGDHVRCYREVLEKLDSDTFKNCNEFFKNRNSHYLMIVYVEGFDNPITLHSRSIDKNALSFDLACKKSILLRS